ncbi:MAG: D-alanyl-D-alanine carboxypeptidase/D-alanyl-D-alanine-endopeptidase [Cytophagales bacterium]|nr:MAG: D-alanyl-D-alanine carboxypeptidase/D-alanyl-D-alanine-endopeptidase [Cytophagales bacterium]
MRKKLIFLFFGLFFSVFFFFSQDLGTKWMAFQKMIINDVSQDSSLSTSNFSLHLKESNSGKVLVNINAQQSMIPASNLKLLTTITAIDLMGADFRFTTTIYTDGKLNEAGILNGNIFIKGGGDPSLGSEKFEDNQFFLRLLKALNSKGITKIQGGIIALLPISDMQPIPDTWVWGDIGNYYGAPCYSLNYLDNMIKIAFKPGSDMTKISTINHTSPVLNGIDLINQVRNGKPQTGDNSVFYTVPFSNTILMKGRVGQMTNKEFVVVKGAHPNPAQQLVNDLHQYLIKNNITIVGKDTVVFSEENRDSLSLELLYKHSSERLIDIVQKTNSQSINLFAEGIYQAIGRKMKYGLDNDSIGMGIKRYWKNKGISVNGMHIVDGSGLSNYNHITASQFTALMSYAQKQTWYSDFEKSIPKAGQSGTLYKFCKGTIAEGKVAAKTGTLSKITCYTGTINSQNQQLLFSMMINFYDGSSTKVTKWVEKLFCKIVDQGL